MTNKKKLGIYIHIPFCVSRCYYCDFYSNIFDAKKVEVYVEELLVELEKIAEKAKNYVVDTVYIGGGTPSLLTVKQLKRIYDKICQVFDTKIWEYTIEVNPNSANNIPYYSMCGINRISFGVQSCTDKILAKIGRQHTKAEALSAIKEASNYFENISADIILGIDKYQKVARDIKLLAPYVKHFSCYMLKVEKGTVLEDKIKNKQLFVASEDKTVDQYQEMLSECEAQGFYRYETSNFAKEGFLSKHNSKYWDLSEYIGIGAGASSYFNGVRYYNEPNINKYLLGMHSGNNKEVVERIAKKTDDEEEFIMLQLRTTKGISLRYYEKIFGCNFNKKYLKQIKNIIDYVDISKDYIAIKPKYFLMQNFIISNLI